MRVVIEPNLVAILAYVFSISTVFQIEHWDEVQYFCQSYQF